jgi:dephospho-CoA kinase
MGKSAAAKILADEGVPVIDTDFIAREVVKPGEPGLQQVQSAFGPGVIASDGSLDRSAVAKKVFADSDARARLESILHPLIRKSWRQAVAALKEQGAEAAVVMIPLLFETGAEQEFKRVICIACATSLQWARLHERGWNAAEVTGRLAAQWPIEKKIERSDFAIWNDSTIEVLREQLGRVPPLKGRRKQP